MWRIFLAFVVHRVFLLAVGFAVLNWASPKVPAAMTAPAISTNQIWTAFQTRVAEGPESAAIQSLAQVPLMRTLHATTHPYLVIVRWWTGLTHMPVSMALLLWSNVFFLLFLWEMYVLLARMVTSDTATSAAILLVLWPTSFEMSLGSGLGLLGFCAVGSVRHALESRWLLSGLFAALLLAAEPMALALLPLLFFIFYYFERNYPISDVAKRALAFFGPIAVMAYLRRERLTNIDFEGSALITLLRSFSSGGVGWLFGSSAAGQTVSLLFFAVGAGTAAYVNTSLIHRMIPPLFWLAVVCFSPYSSLASRLPFAAVCFQGIASASSRQALRMIHSILVLLGAYETWVVFAN